MGVDVQAAVPRVRYTLAVEYDVADNPVYIGEAAFGTEKSEAKWRIKRVTYDAAGNPTDVEWAESNDKFNKVWDDRATYSYG